MTDLAGDAPYTKRPDQRSLRTERVVVLIMIVLPTAGAAAGIALLITGALTWQDHLLFALMYLISGLGVTLGYHRLFTHRAFETTAVVRVVLAIAGAMAFQGPVIRWVADHRRHHGFTDRLGDPHSPVVSSGNQRFSAWRGFWHAHIGWFFDGEKTVVRRYAAELVRDAAIVWVDRMYVVWVLLSVALPATFGYALSGSGTSAVYAMIWAGLARIFLVQHVTWGVNSFCHIFGCQPMGTRDASRNHRLMALLALGEGWHNNHHSQPSAAIHGFRSSELDITGVVIELLERAGLIWDVRRRSVPQDAREELEASHLESIS